MSSSTAPSLTPGHTTIWPRTSMPWSSSARSQRRLIAPRGFLSISAADVGVGGVDADVQRRQPLGDHPLEVGLGEPGERREVPVQERQPVVVVLQVQAAAHALGQLVDEAELAVVVAGANPVEHGARHVDAERLARPLLDREREVEPAAAARRAPPRPRRSASCHSMMSRGTSPLTRTISSPARTPASIGRRARQRRRRRWARAIRRRAVDSRSMSDVADMGSSGYRSRVAGRLAPDVSRRDSDARVDVVLLAQPRGFCAGVEMAIKALAWMVRTLPAARVLLPRDRAQQARRRPLQGARAWCSSTTSPRCPSGSPIMLSAHGSAPEVRRRRPQPRRLRRRLGVPARHQGPPRGEGARRQGLPHRLRRPRGPRGGGRHDGRRTRLDRPGRVASPRSTQLEPSDEPVALLAQTTLSHRDWEGVAVRGQGALPRRVDARAQRPVLRHHQPPVGAHGDGPPVRRRRRDRLGELVQHPGARAAGQRGGVRAGLPGQRRRRAARRPLRHRRRHRRRVGARGTGRRGHRLPRTAPTASSSSTSPTRTSTSRRRATSANCRTRSNPPRPRMLGGSMLDRPVMDDRSLGASDVLVAALTGT